MQYDEKLPDCCIRLHLSVQFYDWSDLSIRCGHGFEKDKWEHYKESKALEMAKILDSKLKIVNFPKGMQPALAF